MRIFIDIGMQLASVPNTDFEISMGHHIAILSRVTNGANIPRGSLTAIAFGHRLFLLETVFNMSLLVSIFQFASFDGSEMYVEENFGS